MIILLMKVIMKEILIIIWINVMCNENENINV